MAKQSASQTAQDAAEERVDHFRKGLGPFVVAAEHTRMPMIFTDAKIKRHPVVFANDAFLLLTGFAREAVLGKGIAHLLKAVTEPATRTAIELALDRSLDGSWEAPCRRANGDHYLATVFLSPVRDEQGIVRQNFLSFVEVSSRTDRLRTQRAEFAALYEQAPGFIAVLDGAEQRFTFANASYKRLVGRSNLIGRPIRDALPDLAGQGFVGLLDRVFETGEPFVGEAMPVTFSPKKRPTGVRYINFVYQPVRDADARITGVFVEGYDVTTERSAAEQLSQRQREVAHATRVNAMGMMTATLAHELNQPLTAIVNYAATCARLVDPDAAHADALTQALQAIKKAAQRAGDIIGNVRGLTKRGQPKKTAFDIGTAVAECIRIVRADGCAASDMVDRTPAGLEGVADRLQFQQVTINLLRNACDATAESVGAVVTVEAALEGKDVVVSVTDTGPGLSDHAAENVFQWTESFKPGGTGLGLSISRAMVEAQDGRIWLERSDPSGAQFRFSVPAERGDARRRGRA
jgi:two-component system sensor kinase FixL